MASRNFDRAPGLKAIPMGRFQPEYETAASRQTARKPLVRLPARDDLCDGCPWPKVCAGDRTCWKAESAAERSGS